MNHYWEKIEKGADLAWRQAGNFLPRLQELFKPAQIVKDIHEIDFSKLKNLGICALIVDIDDTLVPRQVNDISPQVFEWIAERKEEGFKICLASNSRHPLRVKYIGEILNVPAMSLGFKPLPFAFLRSLKILDAKPENAAMIGDQLFMDILGANLVKIHSIYVRHLSAETFLPRIWMRRLEGWVLKSSGSL